MSTDFQTEIQKFSTDNLVILYQLDCTGIGGQNMYFTSSAEETQAVVFNGITYTPVPIVATGFDISGSGTMPQPTIQVINLPILQAGVISLGDLIGAVFYRTRTFRTFLDDGETPDPTATFPIDVFKIDRKSAQTKVYIEWELASSIDQEGRQIPARTVIKDYCTHIYRRFNPLTNTFDYSKATCPYTGSACFSENDQSVTSKSQDRCGKRLTSCVARFGENVQLPTRAFPGVAEVS